MENSPSFGPIVKLKRIGYNKEVINIYKFRTMHPYSEFLQKGLYEKGLLNKNGDKIEEDFRITAWGKFLRKFWIDELPQIYNWLQGDIKLVGVRALSTAKFDLYPKSIQKLRVLFKPGLVPPFYADLPISFKEMLESERVYLYKKIDKKIGTDLSYFLHAIYNIIIKGVRSQ